MISAEIISLLCRIAAVIGIALALFGTGYVEGISHESAKWDAAKAAQAGADNAAILARVVANTQAAARQADINTAITKAKNEDLAPVVAAIAADRLRIGPAVCPRFTAAPDAKSAGSSDGADPARRLVQDQLERDIKSLEVQVEEALAAGRTCQAFVMQNGMAP